MSEESSERETLPPRSPQMGMTEMFQRMSAQLAGEDYEVIRARVAKQARKNKRRNIAADYLRLTVMVVEYILLLAVIFGAGIGSYLLWGIAR